MLGNKRNIKIMSVVNFSSHLSLYEDQEVKPYLIKKCIYDTIKELTPCNLKYNPHALHTGSPFAFLRHNVVVEVEQLLQLVPARRAADCKRRKQNKLYISFEEIILKIILEPFSI